MKQGMSTFVHLLIRCAIQGFLIFRSSQKEINVLLKPWILIKHFVQKVKIPSLRNVRHKNISYLFFYIQDSGLKWNKKYFLNVPGLVLSWTNCKRGFFKNPFFYFLCRRPCFWHCQHCWQLWNSFLRSGLLAKLCCS